MTTFKKPFLKNASLRSMAVLSRIGQMLLYHANAECRWLLLKKDTFCPENHDVIYFEIGSPVINSKTGWRKLERRRKSGGIPQWHLGNRL